MFFPKPWDLNKICVLNGLALKRYEATEKYVIKDLSDPYTGRENHKKSKKGKLYMKGNTCFFTCSRHLMLFHSIFILTTNCLIAIFDPLGQPTQSRPVVIIIFARVVRPYFHNLTKQNNFQARIVIATGGTVSLAEWIIDGTHVLFSLNFCLSTTIYFSWDICGICISTHMVLRRKLSIHNALACVCVPVKIYAENILGSCENWPKKKGKVQVRFEICASLSVKGHRHFSWKWKSENWKFCSLKKHFHISLWLNFRHFMRFKYK